jgi:hypothetical protein
MDTADLYAAGVYLHEAEYVGDDLQLGKCLESHQRPDGISDGDYAGLRRKARNFMVKDPIARYDRGFFVSSCP